MTLLSTRQALFGLAATLAVFGAQAADLNIAVLDAQTVHTNAATPAWNTAGLLEAKDAATGSSFLAYCLEYGIARVSPGSASYTSSSYNASADVQELYDRFYGMVANAATRSTETAAGFQLALWELAGGPAASSFNAPTPAGVVAAAASMLGLVHADDNAVAKAYDLTLWDGGAAQNVLQATAVPEPETYALMLAGLGAIAFLTSRRSQRDQ